MSKIHNKRGSGVMFVARKLFVSAFVVFSFAAYAIHERFAQPDLTPTPTAAEDGSAQTQLVMRPIHAVPTLQLATATPLLIMRPPTVDPSIPTDVPTATSVPPTSVPPTAIPPTATRSGQYADGEYVGPVTDAWYGYVQVKAVVQNGKVTDVQFLQFPNDRRTSQQINAIAMPYLTQEAVQAQSARVNLISGATLTSRAFVMSLQSALQGALG